MSAENKRLVRRWFEEVWNKGRSETVDELLAPDAVVHGLDGDLTGPAGFKPFQARYRSAFPDLKLTIEDEIAEGDRVAVRWTVTATHRGSTLGFPATGAGVRFTGMVFVRIAKGRIAEGWNNFDMVGMLQQLGKLTI
jgi:steroid delta-isomerase-like uncharacterized protein